VGRLLLWLLIILVGLESFGIHVTALVAGLGIGGIAIALAVQNILGDVFAALSIFFDKPFAVGDLIEVGEYAGTVLRIGIKSTRMRSVTGELIILSNGELLKRGIRNFEQTRDAGIVPAGNTSFHHPRNQENIRGRSSTELRDP
jgi:small-conductance mechanosensitive channel